MSPGQKYQTVRSVIDVEGSNFSIVYHSADGRDERFPELASDLVHRWKVVEDAARSLGIQTHLLDIRRTEDIPPAFESASKQPVDAIIVSNDSVTQTNRVLIAELAMMRMLPAVYVSREFIVAGGYSLMGRAIPIFIVALRATSTRFSRANCPAIYQSNNRPSSTW
jgi:hypothetical protein